MDAGESARPQPPGLTLQLGASASATPSPAAIAVSPRADAIEL
jgi:hypothetical protein